MAQVLIDNVTKVYPGNVKAVDNITHHVEDKQFVALVGPSGCGKSTTLRMIAGLEEISGGTITIGDRVVNDVPPKDRDIAMVFQNYALYPHMTVYKNMAFGLKLRKFAKKDIDARVKRAADILGIEYLLNRKPKALSGGQRQRVAVGRAIVREPSCFLFDEPLSNLDAKLRVETRAELKQLHHRLQTTTVYVTHDQEEAMTLGEVVVVMSDGLIQQAAPPLEVYGNPCNRFVASFVGTPSMNLLEGQIVQQEGALWFDGSGIRIKLDADHAERVSGKVGQDVVLGMRPEGFYLRTNEHANNEDQTVEVTTTVVEPLGSQMDIYADTSTGDRLVMRTKAEVLQADIKTKFYLDRKSIHIFEPGEYGLNLTTCEMAVGSS